MAKKQQESAKTKAAKKQQAVSDKTFGLKNKNKSSRVQAFVKQVESQSASSSAAQKRKEAEAERRAAEKKAAEKARLEAAELFKPVATQKVPFGVDPKSVLCSFFKQGLCTKGAKCKFSHNLDIERKAAKKDLYSDNREEEKQNDTMDKWDEEKLRSVVLSKHGNPKTTTDIICKYFIDAVENGKYGWFWVCPNGGDTCKYKHSLPPGFKLKTKEELRLERQNAANQPEITLEDFIETERQKLPKNLTPITLESFTKWKEERIAKKKAQEEQELQKQQKSGNKVLSGKQLLDSGKFVAFDDEDDGNDAWDLSELRRRVESDDEDNPNNEPDGSVKSDQQNINTNEIEA
ncbi:Tma46p [Sugiyamaella lignohabitans]|uniref:Zinc finger CCCH domain-containing protein 15 n=1 Tax=Sugiyamaella lignohabitans TaxID=796027 RepID=A0A161HF44_9ASCO|nr:Tma46p [Sugiyamaella lignohabitans]ANB14060.1 Tma46p [Sugiyamaella lignohabitans]